MDDTENSSVPVDAHPAVDVEAPIAVAGEAPPAVDVEAQTGVDPVYYPSDGLPPESSTPVEIAPAGMSKGGMQLIVVALALVAGLVAYKWLHPSATFATDGLDPRWDAAVERSQMAHTPSLVLFTADWCPACQSLHSQVLSRGDVENEIDNHYTMVTIDMTQPTPSASARASKCGVNAYPTLIRFDAEGKETGRTNFLSPEKMMTWLREGEKKE